MACPAPEESENESNLEAFSLMRTPANATLKRHISGQPTSDDFTQAMNRVLLFLLPHTTFYHSS
jgi:hypothetical protein